MAKRMLIFFFHWHFRDERLLVGRDEPNCGEAQEQRDQPQVATSQCADSGPSFH